MSEGKGLRKGAGRRSSRSFPSNDSELVAAAKSAGLSPHHPRVG